MGRKYSKEVVYGHELGKILKINEISDLGVPDSGLCEIDEVKYRFYFINNKTGEYRYGLIKANILDILRFKIFTFKMKL